MLHIKNLSLSFSRYGGMSFRKVPLKIISDFNIAVHTGEMVAVIGSSGAGKSLLAHAILGILPSNAKLTGDIEFKGSRLTESRKKRIRGNEIALVPQSVAFLDPLESVKKNIQRAAFLNTGSTAKAGIMMNDAFDKYGLADNVGGLLPFQLSGGMARRVLIAAATVSGADLIIADEPTTGLDRNAIDDSLRVLKELTGEGKGVLLITHDIRAALKYADSIAVFYGGTTLEIAAPEDFKHPEKLRHPYTKDLYSSLPENGFVPVAGLNPFGDMIPAGCVYGERCSRKNELCETSRPDRKRINNGDVWCHHA